MKVRLARTVPGEIVQSFRRQVEPTRIGLNETVFLPSIDLLRHLLQGRVGHNVPAAAPQFPRQRLQPSRPGKHQQDQTRQQRQDTSAQRRAPRMRRRRCGMVWRPCHNGGEVEKVPRGDGAADDREEGNTRERATGSARRKQPKAALVPSATGPPTERPRRIRRPARPAGSRPSRPRSNQDKDGNTVLRMG